MDTITWTATDDSSWDTRVAKAISNHCVATREPVPADEEFQTATWEVPAGTVLTAIGYSEADIEADRLRVTAGTRSWVIAIDRDGICGCGECAGAPTFSVVEVFRGA